MKLLMVSALMFLVLACDRPTDSGERQDVVTVEVFRWDMEIADDDEIAEFMEREFGLRIETEAPGWNEWNERLMTRAASGALPDVFVGYGPLDGPTYRQWIDEGLLLPLNEYLHNYPALASYLDRFGRQQVDGRWYSVPVENVTDHVMMLRADWLDDLGMPVPETVAELVDVARTMADAYGVVPITSSAPQTAGFFWLNAFFYAHGSRWDDWVSRDGEWIRSWIADESRETLRFMRSLYREGLLDPDFLTNSDARKRELFTHGEAGIVFHNEVDLYMEDLSTRDPEGRVAIAPPPAGQAGRGMWGVDGYFSSVMIRADLSQEKREAFLSFLDYLHTDAGEEFFLLGVDDVHFARSGQQVEPLVDSLVDAAHHAKLRDLRALEWKWIEPWAAYQAERSLAVEIGTEYSVPSRFENIVTDAGADYEQQLRDIVYSAYAEMVTSDEPLDALWDRFRERYLASGGREVIDELNAHPEVTGESAGVPVRSAIEAAAAHVHAPEARE